MGIGKSPGRDYLMTSDAAWAFDAYEAVRARLPQATFPRSSQQVGNLTDLIADHDVFLLDAFGVLNVGETAIDGAPDHIAALQAAGKTVIVVSNAASLPKRFLVQKYRKLGFEFAAKDVLSSRAVLLRAFADIPTGKIGMMGLDTYGNEELEALDFAFLEDDDAAYAAADSFVLLGAGNWTEDRQARLEAALIARPRPVYVGNPDIVAPRETGLSKEPGFFAHRLADATGVVPQFFGKPFGNIFDMAFDLIPDDINPDRIVMVGDTLQTDILGGRAAGVRTALITGHGALKGLNVESAVSRSGITPDYIMLNP